MTNNKKIKNEYRRLHTHVVEHTVGVGKNARIIKSRTRRKGSPSLKEYARNDSEGAEWLGRKSEQRNRHDRKVNIWRVEEQVRRSGRW